MTASGHRRVESGAEYPSQVHPDTRYFTWEKGRVLANALQLVAIRRGQGVFEGHAFRRAIKAGDVFIICPGHWHRYRPDRKTGWDEDWFELKGPVVESLALIELSSDPVLSLGTPFWKRFDAFHEVCLQRPSGCRGMAAGFARALYAEFIAAFQSRGGDTQQDDSNVYAASRERLLAGASVEVIAREMGMSYASFHRKFKAATQLTAKEYIGRIRQSRAEALLRETTLSIKEIAAQLKFHSAGHFSNEFKKRTGAAPAHWRGSQLVITSKVL